MPVGIALPHAASPDRFRAARLRRAAGRSRPAGAEPRLITGGRGRLDL